MRCFNRLLPGRNGCCGERRPLGYVLDMIHWYRAVVESNDPAEAEKRAASFEHSLKEALTVASSSPAVRVYYDWLAAGRGRVFWLSSGAFDCAPDLARKMGAQPYLGLADMRFLVPLFD